MNIVFKTTNVFLTIVILCLLPMVIFTLISSKTNAVFGIQSFVVLSGSMEPAIPVRSIVYTQKQPSYQKGDVVAFKSGDVNVTHRIVNVNSDGSFQTKGDANNTVDEKEITARDIFGRQLFFLSYIGQLIIFLKTPQGFFSLIFFPITMFLIIELWNLKKEIKKHFEAKVIGKMEAGS